MSVTTNYSCKQLHVIKWLTNTLALLACFITSLTLNGFTFTTTEQHFLAITTFSFTAKRTKCVTALPWGTKIPAVIGPQRTFIIICKQNTNTYMSITFSQVKEYLRNKLLSNTRCLTNCLPNSTAINWVTVSDECLTWVRFSTILAIVLKTEEKQRILIIKFKNYICLCYHKLKNLLWEVTYI
jgi:hypothetical protein